MYKPDPENLRRHPERNKELIRQSLEEVGPFRSIAIDGDGIVRAGNGVYEQAQALGLTIREVEAGPGELIAVKRPDLTGDAARRAAFFDNAGSDTSYFDAALVAAAMAAQPTVYGGVLTDDELAGIIGQAAPVDIGGAGDEFDTTPQDGPTRTQVGELWLIDGGRHRLLVGDCTDAANVARLMGGERAALTPTDPPYNVKVEYGDQVDDDKTGAEYEQFSRVWFYLAQQHSERQIVTPGYYNLASWYSFFGSPYHTAPWIKLNSLQRASMVSTWACWEPILFFGTPWRRDRAHDVFDYPSSEQKIGDGTSLHRLHPCPKPLAMWVALLDDYTDRGDLIYDPFLGSGTTLIAAHQTGRRCYGMEISPRYADVILRRAEAAGLTCTRREH